jgi:uncharacterized protein YcbX
MAQKMIVEVLDDIDGTPADGTVTFAVDGVAYEIDLNQKHADQLAKAIRPFVEKARRISTRRKSSSAPAKKHDQRDVRVWAQSRGMKISDRGRISADVLSQYEASH